MSIRIPVSRSVAMTALAVIATGCSSWRYRGYVDTTNTVSNVRLEKAYYIESVDFQRFSLDFASCDNKFTQWMANKIYVPFYDDLSDDNLRNERTYAQDIAKVSGGFCTESSDGIPVRIELAPHREIARGSWTSLFPLFCSLGIVPSNKSCDVPFDILVSFPDDETGDQKRKLAYAADLRVDSRFSVLSPFGSVRYQQIEGSESCETLAGSWLFGARDEALRTTFVKTVANAVKLAIAKREGLELGVRGEMVYEKDEPPVEFAQELKFQSEWTAPKSEKVETPDDDSGDFF